MYIYDNNNTCTYLHLSLIQHTHTHTQTYIYSSKSFSCFFFFFFRRYVANPTYGRPELVSGEQRSSTDSKCSEPDVQVNMVMNEAYSVTPAGTADYFTLERPEDYHYQDPREVYHYYHNPTDGHLEENHYHLPTNGELEEHHYYHRPMHSHLENHYNCPTHAQRENHYESIS